MTTDDVSRAHDRFPIGERVILLEAVKPEDILVIEFAPSIHPRHLAERVATMQARLGCKIIALQDGRLVGWQRGGTS